MPTVFHAFRRFAAGPVAVSVAALALANAASGQIDDVIFNHHVDHPRIIFTDADVYLVGESSVLCEGKTEITPDPRGRYALITSTSNILPTLLNSPAFPATTTEKLMERGVGSTLLLYDSRTNRTKLIWQHRPHPGEIGVASVNWVNGKDVALVTVGIDRSQQKATPPEATPSSEYTLLEVHPEAASGAAPRVLFRSDTFIEPEPSPKLPVALIHQYIVDKSVEGHPTFDSRYRTLSAAGVVGPLLPLGDRANAGYRWNADGDVAYISDYVRVPKATTVTPAPPEGGGAPTVPLEQKRQWYALSMQTGKLSPLDQPPKRTSPEPIATLPVRLTSDPVAATLAPPPAPPTIGGAPSMAPVVRTAAKVWPLWLQRRSRPVVKDNRPTAALIAGDADSATLMPDASAVFYVADGALHAVPITHQPRADVEGPYRRYLQQVTMSNAKQIGLALLQYSQDYDEILPPAADVNKNLDPYSKDSDLFNNPETNQPAFQYLMDGNPEAKIDSPSTTVMGYLSGPDGRAVLYADGHVRWESEQGEK